MADAVELQGLDQLVQSLDSAAHELAHLDQAAAAAGRLVADASAADAPRRTGRLAASVRSDVLQDQPVIYSDLRYAPIVHARTPFITTQVTNRTDQVLTIYADAAQAVLATVKGN